MDVRILDINDNIPMFDFDSYPVTLFENIAPNSSVDTLFATDADLGLNSQITYSIVSGNSSGRMLKTICLFMFVLSDCV